MTSRARAKKDNQIPVSRRYAPGKHRKKRDRTNSPQWTTAKQLGTIGIVSIAMAFVVSLFFSKNASEWYKSVAFFALKNKAESMGLSKKDLEDVKKAGILKGGKINAGVLKNLSRAQKE